MTSLPTGVMDHRQLLERERELGVLDAAVEAAAAGTGAVVLLAGPAGSGKTSVLRAFRRAVSGRARVLAGACDDLLAPRVLGPLRDAARGDRDGALATALAGSDRDAVLAAVLDALSAPGPPTVLTSRTRTGPTRPPWTCSGSPGGGSPTAPRSCPPSCS